MEKVEVYKIQKIFLIFDTLYINATCKRLLSMDFAPSLIVTITLGILLKLTAIIAATSVRPNQI